ncbi:MAG: inositol monophosphatase family protein [Planctomycetota bacterium]|jgi:myo-inositol-1(or 4)-monophosphatase|nr:inositol monophosphatase family protein [Planctomycetota bacterium]
MKVDNCNSSVDMATVCDIAVGAGHIISESRGQSFQVQAKGSPRDLVTEIDQKAEAYILERLGRHFPEEPLWGEESTGDRSSLRKAPVYWLIDPLDGTINFAHDHPFVGVSIARIEKGVPVLGVVHAPLLGETYWAETGKGAYRNELPIRVSSRELLSDSLLATGFACLRESVEDNLSNFVRLARQARGMRRCGSAALDLAFVACGRFDGFWELALAPYDVAAGVLLVQEAGGRVSDFACGDGYLHGRNIVASNGWIHESILSQLDPLPDEDRSK